VPRLSRTPGWVKGPPQEAGRQSRALLADWNFTSQEIDALHASGAVRSSRHGEKTT
jgi:alpha-methylacyl-CoA racemase